MTKLLLVMLSAAVLGAGGLAAAVGLGEAEPGPIVSLPAPSVGTTTNAAGDISGPCDEAEHRNDPRCTGVSATATTTNRTTTNETEDISGPCDEAEHRNDPRCTGATATGDDNSGPGSGSNNDGGDDDRSGSNSGSSNDDDSDDDDDRSGSNSGRG